MSDNKNKCLMEHMNIGEFNRGQASKLIRNLVEEDKAAFIQKNGNNCYDTDIVPNEVRVLYETIGGNPYLDGAYNAVDRGHTVFAQVIDGMDVVDKIAVVKVDDDDKPVENVVIKSIDITTYSSQATQTTSQSTGTTSAE